MNMKNNIKTQFLAYLNRLKLLIDVETCKDPYVVLRIASYGFKETYLQYSEIEVLALAVMLLYIQNI